MGMPVVGGKLIRIALTIGRATCEVMFNFFFFFFKFVFINILHFTKLRIQYYISVEQFQVAASTFGSNYLLSTTPVHLCGYCTIIAFARGIEPKPRKGMGRKGLDPFRAQHFYICLCPLKPFIVPLLLSYTQWPSCEPIPTSVLHCLLPL